jgi:signal transduction histidine kinase
MNNQGKILIIDDEQIVLDSCTDILAGSNYELATAHDGAQGLEQVSEFKPDVVFVDLKMPGIPGMEVLEKIHEFDPTVVTIVITGFATVSSAVEAMKHGAYDFLPKPFTPAEFRMITARGVEKRHLQLETISLRKEKELLRQNFAAIVSHELKSPLSAVQQNLFVLEEELSAQIDDEQRKRILRMKSRLTGLLDLINTWLRVISEDIESIKDKFRPLLIEDVIALALETVDSHAIRKNIEIKSSIANPLIKILGDEGTLAEVLVNLLDNSIKYSYPGSLVTLAAEIQGELVVVSVSDSGVGISDEELPFVFGDFYRGKVGKEKKGHGLGLALSRRIVELHGGSISAVSTLGEGSTFKVILPVYQPDNEPLQVLPTDISMSPEQGVMQ